MPTDVHLRFEGTDAFPAGAVGKIIQHVEASFYQTESDLLVEGRDEIQETTSSAEELEYGFGVIDRLESELKSYQGDSLVFNWASSGSLILGGAAAALAWWLLENTIGESLKDAWKNSPTHRRLVQFFSDPLNRAHRNLQKLDHTEISVGPGERAELQAELEETYDGAIIHVTAVMIVEKPMPIEEKAVA